ncbi:MAG TPA: hypothetical protein PLB99_12235 [Thermotogota bacterium]|nr:hypothetical protein [Thermotogota bacterium]
MMRVNTDTNRAYTSANGAIDQQIAQLRQQKMLLQKQLATVSTKSKNSQAERDAAAKLEKNIRKKMAKIDEQIRVLSQKKQRAGNCSKTSETPSSKTRTSQDKNNQESQPLSQDNVGRLLDVYV